MREPEGRGEAGLCSAFPVWAPFLHLVTKQKDLSQEERTSVPDERNPSTSLMPLPQLLLTPHHAPLVCGHVYEELP